MMSDDIRGIILDVDGVLEYQGRTCTGALETVAALQARGLVLRFLTNSTLKSRRSCAARLCQAGFQISADQVITASSATALYLRGLNPRSCWVMLEREGLEEFQDFVHDPENPEYVVVGDNRSRFDFAHLNHALRCLLKGAQLIAMSPELVDASMGEVELNVGAWAGMLERAAGVQAVYVGKPSPYVFELTLGTMGLDESQVLMVGDRVDSDVKGARNAGLRSVLLKTGEFKPGDLAGEVQPAYAFDSIRDLLTLFG